MIAYEVQKLQGPVQPGATIRVHGTVLPDANRFAINLQCGGNIFPRDDVAFHFSPDFRRGCVVRSNILRNNWGPDENVGPFPFARGMPFDVVFTCSEESFVVIVNGQCFTTFVHRIPFKMITHVAVDGDITLNGIEFNAGQPSYGFQLDPSQNVPYYPNYPRPPSPNAYATGFQTSAPATPYSPYPQSTTAAPYPHQTPYTPAHLQPQAGYYQGPQPNPVYPGQPPLSPGHPTKQKHGLLDKAGMALAGTLAGGGMLGAVMHGKKGLKANKKAQKKALKYGLPIAGVGLGAYAMKKGFGGFGRSSSSSSSSSD